MQSAFGVEHGEISKAVTRRGRDKAARKNAVLLQRAARRQQIKNVAGAVITAPKKAAHAKISIADVGAGAGKGVTKVGVLVAKKPAVTGTALLGGAGYGAYKYGQKPKKRVAQ